MILSRITRDLPQQNLSLSVVRATENHTLADPEFYKSAPIDLLLGADIVSELITGETLKLGTNMPIAWQTSLGLVLIGATVFEAFTNKTSYNFLTTSDLDLGFQVQKFWRIEEPPVSTKRSKDDEECENHFKLTHSRDPTGRYIVRLPFKEDAMKLGNSANSARKQFSSLEQRFARNPAFHAAYKDFMIDYIQNGHMCVADSELLQTPHYYLPHHGVFKNDKIRVVFNGSAKTSTQISLNSLLHAGPKLHNDICALIMQFRIFPVVFTCDIRQMFRQIQIHTQDQNFQLIYWRENSSQPLKTYQLTTVTYGVTSSPYLANRVIQQLIIDEGENYPLAASALKNRIFVDDCLLGSNSVAEAVSLKEEVIGLMSAGGFELRKWSSSHPELLKNIPKEFCEPPRFYNDDETPLHTVLGLYWNQETDSFQYTVTIPKSTPTRRSILSCIARLYDPMGWLSPVILWAKAFIQHLWINGTDWDTPLSDDLIQKWHSFTSTLHSLREVHIPRHTGVIHATRIELHGFCDASETGLSASTYLRIIDAQGNITVKLLLAKSKVAPLKRISVPRLELCGAHLLAQLINFCITSLNTSCTLHSITAWTDSSVTLSWINTPPYKLQTFVANRVSQIHDLTPPNIWKHIISSENPADVASRGILPTSILSHSLWWQGPPWLCQPDSLWPKSSFTIIEPESLPEFKQQSLNILTASTESSTYEIFNKFSSWTTLVHVTAFILRFRYNALCKDKSKREVNALSSSEIESAIRCILKKIQKDSFPEILSAQNSSHRISPVIQKLQPFRSDDGLIRVGGRLKNSSLHWNNKHPVLLPKNNDVVKLLVRYYHLKYLHAGPQLLQSQISRQYWILSARSLIRSTVFKCIRCYRCRPSLSQPLMGDLPQDRIQPQPVFTIVGVDYAGPYLVKPHSLRRVQPVKAYICLFICFVTKAVHIEMVSALTSEAYIAALTRFVSRRGRPSTIYSDNATNLTGAARLLSQLFREIESSPATLKYFSENNMKFCFIPPRAPHHGGLWERSIQSMKHHLTRVIGEQIVTAEEFETLLAAIEAILNSRPLTPLSSDPADLEALTPGHFIIGRPLLALPEENFETTQLNRLRRWQLVQRFTQHIWRRWNNEYLHTLQQRSKWTAPQQNLTVNDLVIIHEDAAPPLSWRLGRIIKTHPGKDNIVRVVDVKTSHGVLSRPAVKISRLPIDQ